MTTGDTDDRSSARLENEKEEVEEGPPAPLEGQRAQDAPGVNPPPGLVFNNESVDA